MKKSSKRIVHPSTAHQWRRSERFRKLRCEQLEDRRLLAIGLESSPLDAVAPLNNISYDLSTSSIDGPTDPSIALDGPARLNMAAWLPAASVSPGDPDTNDSVSITLSDTWSTGCVPNRSAIQIVGDAIYFDVFDPYTHSLCTLVITPWSLTETLLPLPQDNYTVFASLYSNALEYPAESYYLSNGPSAVTTFSVASSSPNDFGDAPSGYPTLLADDGARHNATGPILGGNRDTEPDGQPTANADGDDTTGTPDDEDGLNNPLSDLTLLVGTAPTVDATVTNNSGSAAMLYGWIDYNGDSVFDNAAERASIAVPHGTTASTVTLVFPVVPSGFAATTYARFRLSTDSAAQNPTGLAADGEVEDYQVAIWHLQDTLSASDGGSGHRFGQHVSIDGNWAMVGAPNRDSDQGAVYVYQRVGENWIESNSPIAFGEAAGDTFGVSISMWGNYAIVGATQNEGKGAAYIYERVGENWIQTNKLTASDGAADDEFGSSVSIQADWAIVGAQDQDNDGTHSSGKGAAYVFRNDPEVGWMEVNLPEPADLEAGDNFGHGVEIIRDYAIVGAPHSGNADFGAAYVYQFSNSTWDLVATLTQSEPTANDFFGASVAVTSEYALVGAPQDDDNEPNSGAAYLFKKPISGWVDTTETVQLHHPVQAANQLFGVVSLSDDYALVGAPNANSAFLFGLADLTPGKTASPERLFAAGSSYFGTSVDIFRGNIIVGADLTNGFTGAAYVFQGPGFLDLGQITFRSLFDEAPSAGDLWYRFETTRQGFLTLEAIAPAAGGSVGLTLYDHSRVELATSTPVDGNQRIDRVSAANVTYFLKVSGTSGDVDLRLVNLVDHTGTSVTVHGTDTDDAFSFAPTGSYEVAINGVVYHFDEAQVDNVHFDGAGGRDTAVVTGSSNAETVDFHPGSVALTDPLSGFQLTVDNSETITVNSGSGDDVASVFDSTGDDTLTATPTQFSLTGTPVGGEAFSLTANNFAFAHAYAKKGGHDTANFTGSDAKDRMKVYPDYLKMIGPGFYNRAKFFESYTADGRGSTKDVALVYGSDATDVLWAGKNELRMDYAAVLQPGERAPFENLTYDVVANGFEKVRAYADGDNKDWAELRGSPTNDVFIAKPHKVEMMNGPRKADGVLRGDEYKITARGFRNVVAVGDAADVAKLYDSGNPGIDTWAADYRVGQTWSTMSTPSRLLYEVLAFERVGGYGFNAGQGPDHGRNVKDHTDAVDFVFQYGYWEE